ncbi:MAG TPA: cellulase family glycosylhydrolase, partial [Blastocatellia bacterium]|nr:cellulase family glycosylhydrolase [Blastocatellia bacterium]
MNRRHFLQTMGYSTLAGIASPGNVFSNPPNAPAVKPRIAVFFEKEFPAIDTSTANIDALKQTTEEFETAFLSASEIGDRLSTDKFDVYVNPYGSAFSKEAWPAILKFLIAGGNFVNLGGVPFRVPVVRNGAAWRTEVEQTGYHKRLGITQAFPVDITEMVAWGYSETIDWAPELSADSYGERVYELYLRMTNSKSFPKEDGSDGPREAVVTPLLWGRDKDGDRTAAPFLQIDRIKGDFAGGRWMLETSNGKPTLYAIRALVRAASRGSNQLYVRPDLACYRDENPPIAKVKFEGKKIEGTCTIEIFNSRNESIYKNHTHFTNVDADGLVEFKLSLGHNHAPGLYRIDAQLKSSEKPFPILRASNGFWIQDEKLLADGKPLTTGEYSFLRDGKPYPITGTTYMASDVHRQFLFEPNPELWNRDFAEMKRNGINMVRTGIWTGWKNLSSETGEATELILRSLDAFLLTARQHDIPVIFTFFAFLPEDWGGENPYLDPKSIAAQKKFISSITQRYGQVNDVGWDLINEPSFCSAKHLWSCRPNYDQFETAAWTEWLKERFPAANDQERESRLCELWRLSPDQTIGLPAITEFEDRNIFEKGSSLKVLEYRLFAQEMFARWTNEMTAAIRSNGNPRQLITVGQDEGGTFERPNNHFLSNAVDFTCNHTWWLNDDLVWDSVMTKIAGRPNLIEETGVMFYEKSDGRAWRTEEEARNLLERKLALAIGVSGSGFIEWIWNTNPYMPSDNEAAIGLLRADGSAKPELKVVREIAAFVEKAKTWLEDREPEQAVMVVPH